MRYEYAALDGNERQYDHIDFFENPLVDAVYVKSNCIADRGNPYIESLPRPKTMEEILNDYYRPISDYDWNEQKKWSTFDRMKAAMQVKQIRFVLPFMIDVSNNFPLMLINSYRCRAVRKIQHKTVTVNNQQNTVGYVSKGKLDGSANAGFALIGYSGCGKTTGMSMVLADYPQVIVHHPDKDTQFTQIVYLHVVCHTNSNFAALYISIGQAIDSALCNAEPVYEEVIRKCKTIGAKANKICELIDLFGIGAIILDEIQLLNFEGNRESTFESLLTIANNTHVAMIVLGTEDAYKKMFPNLRTARRIGAFLEASQYCGNKTFFDHICKKMFKYQWLDEWVELTSEMIDTLYSLTYGIIDQLGSLYIRIQINALQSKEQPRIDSKYIEKISEKYYPGLQRLIAELIRGEKTISEFEAQRKALCDKADAGLEAKMAAIQAQNVTDAIIRDEGQKTERNYDQIFRNIRQNIQNILETTDEVYSLETIEKAIRHVMSLKKNAEADEKALTKEVYKWLKKGKQESRPKAKKATMDPNHIEIKNMLERATG